MRRHLHPGGVCHPYSCLKDSRAISQLHVSSTTSCHELFVLWQLTTHRVTVSPSGCNLPGGLQLCTSPYPHAATCLVCILVRLLAPMFTRPPSPPMQCILASCAPHPACRTLRAFHTTHRDHFCQQLDNSTSGIKATIGRLMQLLQAHDAELAAHLQSNKVRPGV